MAGAGGLAVVLLGGLVAFFLVIGTFVAVGFALFSKNARRGFRLGVASIVTSSIAILLSVPFWRVILSGKDTHGDPIHYADMAGIVVVLVAEALLVLGAIAGTMRQTVRQKARRALPPR
jgi:hypothetical protein